MKNLKKVFVLMLIITELFTGNISAASVTSNYKDVKETDWFAEAIGKLSVLDIVNGFTDGSFKPQGEVTRAQFIKMLVQAMEYKKIDSVSFTDMKPYESSRPHWASVYVETALRNGVIIKAEEGDRIYPDVPLTREDMVMMMFRALKLEPSEGENPYFDLDEPNGYFTKAYEEYLVRGIPMDDKIIFNPTGVTTRAQASVIISRMVDYKEDPEGFVAQAGMEERFANGMQTPGDIALKRELEIKKVQTDPNYIMEPIITVEHNTDPWNYKYFRLYFENIPDYEDGDKYKIESTNYPQLNTVERPRPNGTFTKITLNNWRIFGDTFEEQTRMSIYTLGSDYYTTQDLIKNFPIKAGMKIEFKITVKRGNKEKAAYETVTVRDIKFND